MIGMRLQTLRKQKGLSQEELARRIGTSQTQICRIERGERYPSLRCILRMCRALRIPPNDMLFEEMLRIDMPGETTRPRPGTLASAR